MKQVILFSFILVMQASASAAEPVFGDFVIKTNGSTCMQPDHLAKCIVLEAADAFKSGVGAASSSIASDDNKKLIIPLLVKSNGLYELNINTADLSGWEERFENIPDNYCSLFPGPANQVYHVSKSIFNIADVYKLENGKPSKKVFDLDISSCLE